MYGSLGVFAYRIFILLDHKYTELLCKKPEDILRRGLRIPVEGKREQSRYPGQGLLKALSHSCPKARMGSEHR